MGKQNRINRQRPREAPTDVRNKVKIGIKKIQTTLWKARYLMLIWATWATLFFSYKPLRPGLLMVPILLWVICFSAHFAREWALKLMVLIWPQWILNFLLPEERSVKQYAKKYKLTEKYKRRKGGSVIFCSKYGISVWRGFIDVIISANKRNKSWRGSFSLHDLRMSGHRCQIKIDPTEEGTDANLLMDLSRLAQLLIAEFCTSGAPDKYIKLLYDDMTNAGSLSPIASKSQLFKFLRNHPALKSPRQLTNYTSDLFQAYKMLGLIGMQMFDNIVTGVPVDDWVIRTISTQDKLLNKVLTYRKYYPYNTVPSYGSKSEDLFRFLRNFQEHGGDRDETTKAQNLFNMKDMDFIATYEYCSFIRCLIYELIVRTDMKGLMLEYPWENYIEYSQI